MSKIIINSEAKSINTSYIADENARCPTYQQLNNSGYFTIASSYDSNQLVQKEHVSKTITPDYSLGIVKRNGDISSPIPYNFRMVTGEWFNDTTSTLSNMWLQNLGIASKMWIIGKSKSLTVASGSINNVALSTSTTISPFMTSIDFPGFNVYGIS